MEDSFITLSNPQQDFFGLNFRLVYMVDDFLELADTDDQNFDETENRDEPTIYLVQDY